MLRLRGATTIISLFFLQNIWISKIIPDDMMMAFVWLGSYFVPNIYIRNSVARAMCSGSHSFISRILELNSDYILVCTTSFPYLCAFENCVYTNQRWNTACLQRFILFSGLMIRQRHARPQLWALCWREIEWASERINRHKAFFVLQFSFAFISVTIVIIQYKSLHFQPFYFRI